MPNSSPRAISCVRRSGIAVVTLLITTAVATTGWVAMATSRERAAHAPPSELTHKPPEMVFVPVLVPVLGSNRGDNSPDLIEIVVASKDLSVGTVLARDEFSGTVKVVKRAKEGLPPGVIRDSEELVGKRLSRPVRTEEPICTQDLSKGHPPSLLPEGYDVMSLRIAASAATAGFVGPGSRVDIIATVRIGQKLQIFPLAVNVLVIAVDTSDDKQMLFPPHVVSFAVTEKQALVLSLAKRRGCRIELMLRNPTRIPNTDKLYDIDEIIRFLADDEVWEKQPAPKKPDDENEEQPQRESAGAIQVAPAPRVVGAR